MVLPAALQAPARPAAWGSIALPGGVAAARRVTGAGDETRPSVAFLLDLARRYHSQPVGQPAAPPARFARYLEFLVEAEDRLRAWPGGLRAADLTSADPATRQRFLATIDILGLRARAAGATATIELAGGRAAVERQAWLAQVGVDLADAVRRFGAGEAVRFAWPTDELPLPAPAIWTRLARSAQPLIAALVADDRALFGYVGLSAMDAETLEWIAARPALADTLVGAHAPIVAAFGRSIRLAGGRLVLPGGPTATDAWRAIVGVSPEAPDRFLTRLFDAKGGRLAYFYDAVARASPAWQRHLLDPMSRGHEVFVAANPTWQVRAMPLSRPEIDPDLVSLTFDLAVDGDAGPPWWSSAFRLLPPDRPAERGWWLRWLFEDEGAVADRFRLLAYGGRVLRLVAPDRSPEAASALGTMRRQPALALALERLGVGDPGLVGRAGRAARLITSGNPGDVVPRLRAWQGALATIEQIHRHRSLAPAAITTLVTSLLALGPDGTRPARGAFGRWIVTTFLPGLGVSGATLAAWTAEAVRSRPSEASFFEAVLVDRAAADVTFEWEGVSYRIDRLGPVVSSAAAIRDAARGPMLTDLVRLDTVARHLAAAPADAAVSAIAAELQALAEPFDRLVDSNGRSLQVARDLTRAADRLRRLRRPADALRETAVVLGAMDAAAAEILSGWAYALALSPAAVPARLYAESARAHDFAVRTTDVSWQDVAWSVPDVVPRLAGGGTTVRGSLLGLDLARAADQLRRVPAADPPGFAGISEQVSRTLIDRLALAGSRQDGLPAAEVARAAAAGRALAARWIASPSEAGAAMSALAAAGVSQSRQNLAGWLIAARRGAELEGLLTPTDFYRLGTPADPGPAWGQSWRAVDGCWCLRAPARRPIEDHAGRPGGHFAAATLDLNVRLAELTSASRLPSELVDLVLPWAVQDLIDQARQFAVDDWEGLGWTRRLTAARLEDYLQGLIAERFLVPPRDGASR